MISFLLNLDSHLTHAINSFLPHNQFFNVFFLFFSQRGESFLIWVAFLLFLILFEEHRNKKFIIYFLVSFVISGILVNAVIKNVVKRPRPSAKIISSSCPKDFSFPSGHASAAFSGAVIFSYFDKKRRLFYFSIAALIALSRIYLNCHYLFDVLAGALIGTLVSLVFLQFGLSKHTYR